MLPELRQRLLREMDSLPIYDIHTHISAGSAFAKTLADLVGYHYYTELTNSAEYRPDFHLGAGPEDLVRQVVERLPLVTNTVQYDWLMVIGEEFLGIRRHEWSAGDWGQLLERAQRTMAEPGYGESVLSKARIRRIYMTNQPDDNLACIDRGLFVPCLRVDGFVFEMDKQAERQRLERASGRAVASSADYEAAVAAVFDRFAAYGMAYAAISTIPNLRTRSVASEEAEGILRRALAGERLDDVTRGDWAAYAMNVVAANCRRVRKPFHLMVGVRRGAYARGVGGQDLFDSLNSLAGYDHLFNEYWDVRFPVSVLSDTTGLELAASCWMRHNLYPSGHWWYGNSPTDIARELRRRLDIVPLGKIIAYYSDAYHAEYILPKFRMYRYELASALAERMERSEEHPNMVPLSFAEALDIAEALLVRNPCSLFEGG